MGNLDAICSLTCSIENVLFLFRCCGKICLILYKYSVAKVVHRRFLKEQKLVVSHPEI